MTCGMGARARALGAGRGAALLRRTPLMSCGILINEKIPRGKTHGNRTADFVSPSSEANANCFYKVQLWADGKVTAEYGHLEQEGKGGSYQIVAMDLQPDQAKKVFDKDIKKQEKKGYVQQQRPKA